MENFLSNFTNTNTTTKSNNGDINVSPEFYGEFVISKGSLSMTVNFFARVYKSRYENYISLDDWDINQKKNVTFNGLPIDDLNKLINSMKDSGLSTIAEGLHIFDKDFGREIAIQVQESKVFKAIYGKKARLFDSLSDKDTELVVLKFAIENYDTLPLNDYAFKNHLVLNEDGTYSKPSLEKLKELYNELKN